MGGRKEASDYKGNKNKSFLKGFADTCTLLKAIWVRFRECFHWHCVLEYPRGHLCGKQLLGC